MKSSPRGKSTLAAEVTNISPHGLWLLVRRREMFLAFTEFPWFRDATIGQIMNVEMPSPRHLHWPELDVDLAVESIEHPERYPLVSRAISGAPYAKRASRVADAPRRGARPAPSRRS